MTVSSRSALLGQGLRLEYFTVGWNLVQGVVSIAAALAAGSVALSASGSTASLRAPPVRSSSGGGVLKGLTSTQTRSGPWSAAPRSSSQSRYSAWPRSSSCTRSRA